MRRGVDEGAHLGHHLVAIGGGDAVIEHREAVLVDGLERAALQRSRACFARGGRGLASKATSAWSPKALAACARVLAVEISRWIIVGYATNHNRTGECESCPSV